MPYTCSRAGILHDSASTGRISLLMTRSTRVDIIRSTSEQTRDEVAVEEPLEIRVGDRPLSVTLRTPGDDAELATGFVITESVVKNHADIAEVRHWGSPNVVRIALKDGISVDWQRLQRHFYATSSCGVCGKTSIDALRTQSRAIASDVRLSAKTLIGLPARLREEQQTFDATGGLHAAAAFTADGQLLSAREDVGRHNAVDKVIGSLLRESSAAPAVMMLSGRAGFELIQKAVVARIPIVAAVGAPSSLAVELAREMNVTLIGFLRDGRYNVYSGEQRVV